MKKLTKKQREKLVAAWVAALRSGKFRQGRGELELVDDNGPLNCCLGVLCRVFQKEFPKRLASRQHDNLVRFFPVGDPAKSRHNYLPLPLAEAVGLSDTAGTYRLPVGTPFSLAMKNDAGASFEDIAELIESRPEGLFQEEAKA